MATTKKEQDNQELITALCHQAGEVLQGVFGKESSEEWKRGTTRFPEVELRLIYLVAAFVENYFPGDRLFGKDEPTDFSGDVWVCDPVDGSYFFTHGIPLYSFSVSLLRDGEPIIAAIYDPVCNRLYYAEKGKGTTLNGRRVNGFPSPGLANRIIMLSGPHGVDIDLGGLFNDLKALGSKAIISYSTVQHAAFVASGEIAAVVSGGTFIQDVAAVKLIVEEAGGIVTDLDGKPHDLTASRVRGFVVAHSQLHASVLAAVSCRLLAID